MLLCTWLQLHSLHFKKPKKSQCTLPNKHLSVVSRNLKPSETQISRWHFTISPTLFQFGAIHTKKRRFSDYLRSPITPEKVWKGWMTARFCPTPFFTKKSLMLQHIRKMPWIVHACFIFYFVLILSRHAATIS